MLHVCPFFPERHWMLADASCNSQFKQWPHLFKSVSTIFCYCNFLPVLNALSLSLPQNTSVQSRVAQRKCAVPVTQRSVDWNHPLVTVHALSQQGCLWKIKISLAQMSILRVIYRDSTSLLGYSSFLQNVSQHLKGKVTSGNRRHGHMEVLCNFSWQVNMLHLFILRL